MVTIFLGQCKVEKVGGEQSSKTRQPQWSKSPGGVHWWPGCHSFICISEQGFPFPWGKHVTYRRQEAVSVVSKTIRSLRECSSHHAVCSLSGSETLGFYELSFSKLPSQHWLAQRELVTSLRSSCTCSSPDKFCSSLFSKDATFSCKCVMSFSFSSVSAVSCRESRDYITLKTVSPSLPVSSRIIVFAWHCSQLHPRRTCSQEIFPENGTQKIKNQNLALRYLVQT